MKGFDHYTHMMEDTMHNIEQKKNSLILSGAKHVRVTQLASALPIQYNDGCKIKKTMQYGAVIEYYRPKEVKKDENIQSKHAYSRQLESV